MNRGMNQGLNETYLWSGFALVTQLCARVRGRTPQGVTGISIDTRSLQPGDLFFAIQGEASDGHDYVGAALAKGAAAVVIDEKHADTVRDEGATYIVDDVLASMEKLGRAARQRCTGSVIAVTGSVGKTGVKEALRTTLSRHGETHASAASYNNHWGVPLSLARMSGSTRFGVFEIGMNHAGEITPLTGMVSPDVAIVTTIAPVHLEHFGSLTDIAEAKAEIFSGLVEGGAAVINRDIEQFGLLASRALRGRNVDVLTFGEHEAADARLLSVTGEDAGSRVAARILGEDISFYIGAPGKHLAMNSMAVLLACARVGVSAREAAQGLGDFAAPAGRGQRLQLRVGDGALTLIDESYNANPTSMRAALALLGECAPQGEGRRIAVLGDMLELGAQAETLHRDIASTILERDVDLVFAAGPMMRHLHDALPAGKRGGWSATSAALEAALKEALAPDDVVMVKGSNGSRMGPIVTALKQHFCADGPG